MLSPDKGPDGAKVAEMMKYRRKIPMTKPRFEPRVLKWESDALRPTPSEPHKKWKFLESKKNCYYTQSIEQCRWIKFRKPEMNEGSSLRNFRFVGLFIISQSAGIRIRSALLFEATRNLPGPEKTSRVVNWRAKNPTRGNFWAWLY